ncbi:hypothetical protein [Psychroserpens mesophilus]|uniref:hypothetical protein n=1 Tax=Psychroserpens mesophilus TaxID=325473 RepID=UPI003D654B5E
MENEFNKLREELILRLGSRQNILNWTIIIIGAFFSFSFTQKVILLLAFCPPIVMVMSFIWCHNEVRVRQLGLFLRTSHQNDWEKWRKKREKDLIFIGLKIRDVIPLLLFVIFQIFIVIVVFTPFILISETNSNGNSIISITKTGTYIVLVIDILSIISSFMIWLKVKNQKQ